MTDIRNINFTDSIEDALQGDSRAFTFLYNQTYAYFRSIVTKQIGADERTDDVMQEIYLTIFESLPTLQNPQAFLSWGARIARNTAINEFKRQSALKNSQIDYISPIKESEDELSLDEFEASAYDREINPEAAIDAQETSRLINEILDTLPASQRICIVLWSENRTYQEIADDIGMSLNTVKSNVRYAKKKVKAKVEALAAQGTKLYGMAPLPFFLWLLRKYDVSILSTKDIKPDVRILQMTLDKLYRKHLEWRPNDGKKEPNAESGSDTGKTADESADSDAGESDAGTADSDTTEDAGNACDSDGADEGPEDFREGGETKSSGAAGNGSAGTAAGTAAKTAAAGGSVLKKVIIGLVCIAVAGGAAGGFIMSRTNSEQTETTIDAQEEEQTETEAETEPEEQVQTGPEIISDTAIADLPTDSQALAEMLNLTYIGNELYYGENSLEAPLGCISACIYDLDQDGQVEILTIENEDASFEFMPIIRGYEYEEGRYLEASIQTDLSELTASSDLAELTDIWQSCKYYIYDSCIVLSNTCSNSAYGYYAADQMVYCAYRYANGSITREEDSAITSATQYDLYAEGQEVAGMVCLSVSTSALEEYGWSGGDAQAYCISLVEYSALSSQEIDGFTVSYPAYFDDYLIWPQSSDEYGYYFVYINNFSTEYMETHLFFFINTYFEYYEFEYDERSGLYYAIDGEVLLWDDGTNCLVFGAAGDALSMLYEAGASNQNLELYAKSYLMMLYSLEEIPYHFAVS